MAKGIKARFRPADVVDIRTRSRPMGDQAEPGWLSLAPSDFAFLWDECTRCFYLKVVRREGRPRTPFPNVFGTIDRAMKRHYLGQRTDSLALSMPRGVIKQADRFKHFTAALLTVCWRHACHLEWQRNVF